MIYAAFAGICSVLSQNLNVSRIVWQGLFLNPLNYFAQASPEIIPLAPEVQFKLTSAPGLIHSLEFEMLVVAPTLWYFIPNDVNSVGNIAQPPGLLREYDRFSPRVLMS